MAYERLSDSKLSGDGLDVYVDSIMKSFSRQLANRNASDEARFANAVLEENLTLEDQLNYRTEQLKRVSDDPEERKRVRKDMATLKDRIEAKKFSDDYTAKLIDFESGMSSIESIVGWLRTRKESTTDQNILAEIDKQLVTMEGNKFKIQKDVLENQTKFALEDKTASIIDAQITRVSAAKNSALLSGNSELATTYDLHLQSLSRAKTENSVDAAAKNFAVATMSGYMSATGQLDAFNQKIGNASVTGSFKIGGVTYNSEKEFWQFKRDSFIADDSDNGFFSRFKGEQETSLKVRNSNNLLKNEDVAKVAGNFASLVGRPELQTYSFKIDAARQSVIQTGVDLRSKTIYNNYLADNDINNAFSNLNTLKGLGGNVEDIYTKVLTNAAEIKSAQVSNILSTAQALLKDNPQMTPQQALDEALKTGAGAALSPTQLASKSEADIAKETAAGAAAGSFTPDPRTTTTPANAPANVPPVTPDPNAISKGGQYYKIGNDVFEAASNRKLDQKEFQSLGLNYDLLPSRAPQAAPASIAPTPKPAPTPTTVVPENQNLSKSGQYYKLGTDVYAASGNRKITLDEFKSLGLNFDLLPNKK